MKADFHEFFTSIQGEGLTIGQASLFIRFSGCNLHCSYCDTPASIGRCERARIYSSDSNTYSWIDNPLDLDQFKNIINQYQYHNVSFTGGEPLLQNEFIEASLPLFKDKVLLMETNGSLPERISDSLLERIDIWSVDYKLPGTTSRNTHRQHLDFLNKLRTAGKVTLKVVFSSSTPQSELEFVLDLASQFPTITLVFQPMTLKGDIVMGDHFPALLKMMSESSLDIRLIPQIHPLLKVL